MRPSRRAADMADRHARFQRLEPLIDRALELEDGQREQFLALLAEIHPDLIEDLRRVLLPEAGLPELGGLAHAVARDRTTHRGGLRVGSWRLLEKIGQGGMGTVYRAERADGAFEKQVAIKLLRGGDARFRQQLERERALLARLDHPGIARLIDGGVLQDDQPWLAMELAAGEDLGAWLRRVRPSLALRLEVFLSVCAAVSHAHAGQVVHRDLKPGNIRVTDDGVVKLLDFGIARLVSPDQLVVGTRQVAVTPEYAAPEQLLGEPITTRVDVHALGALLYLLLTGQQARPRFGGNWVGYLEQIRDHPPVPPSQAATSKPALAVPASSLRGDLDAIVAKAMAWEPTRRYASVADLGADIRRHLAGEPVLAHARTWRYRCSKWWRRYWPLGLLLVAFLLVLGATVAVMALYR